jgi:hypothetical protein
VEALPEAGAERTVVEGAADLLNPLKQNRILPPDCRKQPVKITVQRS